MRSVRLLISIIAACFISFPISPFPGARADEAAAGPAAASGERLPGSSEAVGLWWALSGWKVNRAQPLPEERGEAVRISAARNETDAAQLVVRPERELRGFTAGASELRGPGGASIPAENIELLRVRYVDVSRPTDRSSSAGPWPDPLPPLAGPIDLAAGVNQPLWIRVRVPRQAAAGEYSGSILLAAEGYRAEAPLRLRVFDFELPDRMTCTTAFGFSPGNVWRYQKVSEPEERRAVLEKYWRSFSAHHISPYDPAPLDPFRIAWPKVEASPAASAAALEPAIEWTAWDRAMEQAIGRFHFNSFKVPVPGLGGGTFHSRHQPELLGFGEDTPQYRALLAGYLKNLEAHLRARGWLDEAYVYWFDEPEPKDYQFVMAGFRKLKEAAPDLPRMLTEEVQDELLGGPDIWCAITPHYNHEAAEKRRAHGERFWWYVCTGPKAPYATLFIDHPATELRVWLWQTWKRKIDGILVWQTNYWTSDAAYPDGENPQDPYADPMGWVSGYSTPKGERKPWGNGDGRFIYPPEAASGGRQDRTVLDGPVDSIRWEMLRDGIEDYEYLAILRRLLAERGGALAAAEREGLARLLEAPASITTELTAFTRDPAPIEERRREIAAAIEKLGRIAPGSAAAPAGGPSAGGRSGGEKDVLASLRRGHPRLYVAAGDLPEIRERIEKDPVSRRWLERLQETARRMLSEPPAKHELIGPRLLGQSRAALERISTLAGLYLLDGDRRKAERARTEMLAAAAFPDWNPSHFLDTAEMAHALAIGYDWLHDFLSAEDRAAVRAAIIEKGLEPGRRIYAGKSGWSRARHNWSQVCNGGMTIAALAIADEQPALAGEIIDRARESIAIPMREFSPDGGWAEGPGYWNYATRYNIFYLAALETALGTDFDFKSMPGFADTGLFRIHTTGPGGLSFNFADAGERAGGAAQMLWLARAFDRPVYARHEIRLAADRSDIFHLLWRRGGETAVEPIDLPLDALFRGVDVACFRSSWDDPQAIYLGFKGGSNRANHSHLDLGTFIIDALGERWATDLGPDDYNLPGYFGRQRWTYYRLRTEGQNTLVIDGENQDPAARAPIIAFHSSPQRAFAVADLGAGYAPRARSVRRGVALLDRRRVLIQDEVEAPQPVEVVWNLHTRARVEAAGARALLSLGEKRMEARILSPAGARFEVRAADPPPPQRRLPDVSRLEVRLDGKAAAARIAVIIAPAGDAAPPAALDPLEVWIASGGVGR